MAKHPSFINDLLKNRQPQQGQPAPQQIDPNTVQLPGLGQLGQQGLAEFNAPAPSLTPGNVNLVPSTLDPSFSTVAPTAPTESGIGDRIFGNLADSRFGQFLGKIETVSLDPSGQVRPGSGEAAFPALREQAQVEPFGSSNPAITGPSPAPTGPLSTPESIAGLSFNGTPLTPDIFNQAPVAQAAPQAPIAPPSSTIGGTITRDSTGETTSFRQGGGQFTPQQSEIDQFNTFSDFQSQVNPATRDNAALASAPRALSPIEQANVDAGRPPNVSASDVQVSQRQEVQREADTVQRAAQGRIEEGMKQFTRDNRNATVGEQQQQRALLVAQEAETSAGQAGGLSFDQNLALRKQGFTEGEAGRKAQVASEAVAATEAEGRNMAVAAIQGAVENLGLIEGVAEEIKGLTFKNLTEGNFGRAAALISPTSSAAQIERMTETLAGDAFVDSILELKRMGGTVGQVSNAEGEKLTAAKQRLMKPGMGDTERRKAVEGYLRTKRKSVQNLYNAFVKQHGEVAAQEAFGGSQSGATGGSGQPRYANDQNFGSEVESFFKPSTK